MKKMEEGLLLVASYQCLREEQNLTMHWPPQLIFQYPNCNKKRVKQAFKGSSQLNCMKVSWTRPSIILTSHISSLSSTCLLMSKILSSIVIFPKKIFITPLRQLIKHWMWLRKGDPKWHGFVYWHLEQAQCLTQQNQQENRMHPP